LGALPDRRKAILLLGDGIDVDVMSPLVPGIIGATRNALAAAARSNVAIYGIHALGLTGLLDDGIVNGTRASLLARITDMMEQNLHVLSDQTGGFAVIKQNDFTDAYARIVRDMSSYYLLAYAPAADDRDGVEHTIDVKVRRPGVTVRARRSYTSQRLAASTTAATNRPSAASVLSDTLKNAVPVTGLTFEVFAAPFRTGARTASVVLGIEVPGDRLSLGAGETIELSYVAIDTQGKVRATDSNTIALGAIGAATRARIERTGIRALNRLELAPGRYQLRVAVYETAGGARGSVLYDLDVPDFRSQALSMSGIVMTSVAAAEQPTPRFDDRLKSELQSVLPGPPGARRVFARSDEMAAFVEAYVGGGAKSAELTVTTTLTAATGAVVFRSDQKRRVVAERCQIALRLPMNELAPGTYTLAFAADAAPAAGKPIVRQVSFAVADR
jgi:hypothetical protein